MKKRLTIMLIILGLTVSGCGCAMNWPKQFEKNLSRLDRKGLVLMTLTFDDKRGKPASLLPFSFLIGKNGNDNYKKYHFNNGMHLRALTESREFDLIVLEVDNADYLFYSVRGNIVGNFSRPLFEAPMLVEFQTEKNEILYVGNIHLVLRKKVSNSELCAGPITPLLDQLSVASATFDVEIKDEYERDMNEFKKVFPKIEGHNIVKKILPPWRRPSSKEFKPKKTHFFF